LEFFEGGLVVFEGGIWEVKDARAEEFCGVGEGLDLKRETDRHEPISADVGSRGNGLKLKIKEVKRAERNLRPHIIS
jgi:hypothetical protein